MAGYMLAHHSYTAPAGSATLLLIVYAIVAFGGQLPLGFWVDRLRRLQPFAHSSMILLPVALLVYPLQPAVGIVLSAIASALVHVVGGAVCLQVHEEKTGPLALFTAPGVLGLTLGGLLGASGGLLLWVLLPTVVMVSWLILRSRLPIYQPPAQRQSELDGHDWLMLGLLLVMCFRSFLFDVINQVGQLYSHGLFVLGLATFAGKILGGFVADKIGWKKYVYITLPLALLLFQLGKHNLYALAFGIACLQSSVPITLLLMGRSLPQFPATATALSLGTSIALAGLPMYMLSSKQVLQGWFGNWWLTAVFFVVLLGGMVLTARLLYRKIQQAALVG